jgi:hypothetical protein
MSSDLPKFCMSQLKKHTHTPTSDTHPCTRSCRPSSRHRIWPLAAARPPTGPALSLTQRHSQLSSHHSACSRLIRNISKIQSQLKNDTSRTKRFRISGESRSQSAGIESGPQGPLSYQSVCLDPGPAGYCAAVDSVKYYVQLVYE